jgi:hypothetical protein
MKTAGSSPTLTLSISRYSAWLQKGVVMFLYKRMFHALPWMDKPIAIYWFTLFATFVVAQVTTFTECHPFYLYWQVLPDPGMYNGLLNGDVVLTAMSQGSA